jgi:hypothetical protein
MALRHAQEKSLCMLDLTMLSFREPKAAVIGTPQDDPF